MLADLPSEVEQLTRPVAGMKTGLEDQHLEFIMRVLQAAPRKLANSGMSTQVTLISLIRFLDLISSHECHTVLLDAAADLTAFAASLLLLPLLYISCSNIS